jgi:hypothetical protein
MQSTAGEQQHLWQGLCDVPDADFQGLQEVLSFRTGGLTKACGRSCQPGGNLYVTHQAIIHDVHFYPLPSFGF